VNQIRPWHLVAFVVALVVIIGGPPVAHALSVPLKVIKDSQVALNATTPTAIAPNGASSMCIQNTSATCIQVGGPTVTATTGIAVGSGCAAGQVLCLDATKAFGFSTSGSVTVNVLSGSQ